MLECGVKAPSDGFQIAGTDCRVQGNGFTTSSNDLLA